jgi:ABC-type sugar transport system ATPase subunit
MIYVTHNQAEAMTLADRLVVMHRGIVQQVDRPLAIYERPSNRFVANFLGWPPMNFVHGLLQIVSGQCSFMADGWTLPAPAELVCYAGRVVTFGIRPEHLEPAGIAPGRARLAMKVVLLEQLGHVRLATLERNGWYAVARLAGDRQLRVQEIVEVNFHMSHAHWFNRESGLSLAQARPAG